MKPWLATVGISVAFLGGFVGAARACGIDWQVPVNHFDGVNEFGKLSYWREIGEMDLGDDLKVPLVLGFNPTRRISSALGNGWFLGPMDANLVQINENDFMLTQPDGILREFWKNNPTDTILQGQGDWKGEIKGNSVTLWAQCGWKLVFSSGKIHSIATPKGRVLDFVYGDNGKVSEIQENGETVLRVDGDQNGNINGLTYGKKQVGIEHVGIDLGERPRVDVINGIDLVGGMEQSLHRVVIADGTQEVYDFSVDDQIQPKLTVSGSNERSFTWSPVTGQALKDGEWTYSIHLDADPYKNARIERANAQKQREYWYLDKANGTETTKGIDGTQYITNRFASGPVAGQIRNTEIISPNGVRSTVYQATYDENGNRVRVFDHGLTVYYYQNKIAKVVKDNVTLWKLSYDDDGNLKSLVRVNKSE